MSFFPVYVQYQNFHSIKETNYLGTVRETRSNSADEGMRNFSYFWVYLPNGLGDNSQTQARICFSNIISMITYQMKSVLKLGPLLLSFQVISLLLFNATNRVSDSKWKDKILSSRKNTCKHRKRGEKRIFFLNGFVCTNKNKTAKKSLNFYVGSLIWLK